MKTITPYEYPIPGEGKQRLKFSALKTLPGLPLVLLSPLMFLMAKDATENYVVMGFILTTVLIYAWSMYWYYQHPHFKYDVLGITIVFQGPEYWVPYAHMYALVTSVLDTWEPHLKVDPVIAYNGTTILFIPKKPHDPGMRGQLIGATYHDKKTSYVWGPYALHDGGAGYEMMLHGAEFLMPRSTEDQKIAFMQDHGMLDLLASKMDAYLSDTRPKKDQE